VINTVLSAFTFLVDTFTDARSHVSSIQLNMPLESTTPTEIPVLARQMGGRPLDYDSPLWKTLFPSIQLRIDGRVPIDRSAQFLLQMRMNSSKELVAVAFSPPSEQQNGPFKSLIGHLLGKK